MNPAITKKDVLIILSSAFPNLNWESSNTTNRQYGCYRAVFLDLWGLTVDVFPHGCMATLVAGNSIITQSPNEQGKTLQEVLIFVRQEWDEVALKMSAVKWSDRP